MRLTSGMLCKMACEHRILMIGAGAIINVFVSVVLCFRVQRGNLRGGGGLGGIRRWRSNHEVSIFIYYLLLAEN